MIIEDTRQKKDKHTIKNDAFKALGIDVLRRALPFGDYAYPPPIAIDTKENMQELAMDVGIDHKRFRQECELAKQAGSQLYILIETEWESIKTIDDVHLWYNPRLIVSKKAITGSTLEKAIKTMSARYGVKFMFCRPEESAEMIIKILNGDFEDEQQNIRCRP